MNALIKGVQLSLFVGEIQEPMEPLADIFDMPLFPHIYAIPMSVLLGMVLGYILRGKLDAETPRRPTQRPRLDRDPKAP